MNRFRNILLVQMPGGGSPEAFRRACDLARRNQARLKVLSAIGPSPNRPRPEIPAGLTLDLEELVRREQLERLEDLVFSARAEGLGIETCVRTGAPFVAIIREVLEHGHDLVIKTAEGADGLRKRIFGTTGLHLIRKCPCPVWIVKPWGGDRPERILVAVDPSPDDDALAPNDGHFQVNDRILELAISMARTEGSELVIGHAWSVYAETLLRARGRMSRAQVDALTEATRDLHRSQLEELLARHDLSGIPCEIRMAKGEPGPVIASLAEKERADLVVMGSIGRSGIAGLLIGNTAEEVLGRVNCSVLTVKPDHFVSPVRLDEAGVLDRSPVESA